jgi:EAL domain-containing protein (putative c-di-GMP-specific phosphodiesterase class I)
VILCEDLRGPREAMRVAERARSTLAEPFVLRGTTVALEASVGIARARREQTQPQELIREADLAMYQAKRRGGGIESYEETGELELEARLREAVQCAGLHLEYQLVLVLDGGGLHSVEALVRWEHPERGLQPPAEFLPLAEESGLIVDLDQWVIAEACRTLARWRDAGVLHPVAPMSVNLASRSLRSPELAATIERAVAESALSPGSLALEITEAAFEPDVRGAATALEDLARSGVQLCLDDFGLERASLTMLTTYPFSAVKLDRATTAVSTDAKLSRMLGALVAVVHAAEKPAIAKGIETVRQLRALSRLGCDAGQGFRLAAPAPAEKVERWLAARSTR